MSSDPPRGAGTPSRHDPATIPCPICRTPFAPAGKRLYCSPACNAAAYRRRKHAAQPPAAVPPARPRKPITVYECNACGTSALGQQRCADCGTFMRRVGLGGACPHCEEIVTITDLLGEEVGH
jgi:hypothetical protein